MASASHHSGCGEGSIHSPASDQSLPAMKNAYLSESEGCLGRKRTGHVLAKVMRDNNLEIFIVAR
jgi:hypothetical protein